MGLIKSHETKASFLLALFVTSTPSKTLFFSNIVDIFEGNTCLQKADECQGNEVDSKIIRHY